MSRSGLMVLVQVDAAVEGATVIVVFEGQTSPTAVPVPGQRRGWRQLSAGLAAGMLVRALCGSAALALMHEVQQVRWAEVSDWLTF
ncbi:hypothetical protein ACWC9R_28100 [Streptomyces sp. NPDC001219]